MYIKPTKGASGYLDEIHEDTMDLLIYPVNDEIACPWDASISVEGDKVILEGSIRGGSASTYKAAGFCRCECSVDNFTNFYRIEAPDSKTELISALAAAGWIEA